MTARALSFRRMRAAARRRLPRGLFDYIDRGVGEEYGLRQMRARLDAVEITPRVLRADRHGPIGCDLFGRQQAAPFVIAPTAMAGLIEHDGEIALARAAAGLGVPVCLSTQSVTPVGRLRQAVPGADIWMQLYLWQDRDLSADLLGQARAAGATVLVMTVDTPYGARKEWNIASGFGMPFRISPRGLGDLMSRPGWILRSLLPALRRGALPTLGNYPAALRPRLLGGAPDPRVALRSDLNWDDVAWVRDRWPGKLVLKGILAVDDARRAADLGADGIVVSSHGARNMDAAPASIDVLPQIAGALAGRLTLLADGGVHRGLDILRYRLRGADAVMLGRLPLWALAAGGGPNVAAAFGILCQEYREALDFSGAAIARPG